VCIPLPTTTQIGSHKSFVDNAHIPVSIENTAADMKIDQLILPIILTAGLVSSLDERGIHPRDECTNPVSDTCAFYIDCLEHRTFPCGPTGYVLSYGQPYCQKFTAARSLFSPKGQAWVFDTMLCLQQALVPEATNATGAVTGCSALATKAFASHAKCYVDSGVCKLGVRDWLLIVEIVGINSVIMSSDGIKAAMQAIADCVAIWGR